MAALKESFITTTFANVRSVTAPVIIDPPMVSIWSAICSALRVVVPWSRSCPTRLATPPLPCGSCAAPAPTIRRTVMAGCS